MIKINEETKKILKEVNESFNTYAVCWREFDKHDRVVSKQKEFKTIAARDSFIAKLKEKPNFYDILSYADPEISK